MAENIVVAIDGPAASGKSTVARALARTLGFRYLDSGAMYRALSLSAVKKGIALDDEKALARTLKGSRVTFENDAKTGKVFLDGEDVTEKIRSPEITEKVFYIAQSPAMRGMMRKAQRDFAARGPTVAEGRDMGTVVFDDAKVKFYLDADEEVRARRRLKELSAKGSAISFEKVLSDMRQRDKKDMNRSIAPLRKADDACFIDTTDMKVEDVVELLASKVRQQLAHADGAGPC